MISTGLQSTASASQVVSCNALFYGMMLSDSDCESSFYESTQEASGSSVRWRSDPWKATLISGAFLTYFCPTMLYSNPWKIRKETHLLPSMCHASHPKNWLVKSAQFSTLWNILYAFDIEEFCFLSQISPYLSHQCLILYLSPYFGASNPQDRLWWCRQLTEKVKVELTQLLNNYTNGGPQGDPIGGNHSGMCVYFRGCSFQ